MFTNSPIINVIKNIKKINKKILFFILTFGTKIFTIIESHELSFFMDNIEKPNIPDKTNMTPSTNISTFGEIYDDVSMEFSRRYYKYEPTSKLERKRKISYYF